MNVRHTIDERMIMYPAPPFTPSMPALEGHGHPLIAFSWHASSDFASALLSGEPSWFVESESTRVPSFWNVTRTRTLHASVTVGGKHDRSAAERPLTTARSSASFG